MLSRVPSVLLNNPKKNNLQRSAPDRRDHRIALLNTNSKLPSGVNLKSNLPFVFDQGQIGSCTANSAGSMYSWVVNKNKGGVFVPSRMFLYYNTRVLHGTVSYDSGASLRNTMKALKNNGVCREATWPYLYDKLFTRPTENCYDEGSLRQAISYASVPININTMKTVVQARPFVLGIFVYSSFYNPSVAKTGIVPVPDIRNEKLLGGHAILVMGYDDRRKSFLCRNSWGTSWGINGDFYLPYAYATNPKIAFDAWVLYSVEMPLTNVRVVVR